MSVLFAATLVLALGVGAQWLAWQRGLPSILLLLGAGFLAGPVLGILDPSMLQGTWVYSFVSVSIGVILFEGGLNLRLSELEEAGPPIRNLLTIGAAITWAGATAAVYVVEGFGIELALLTGAILVVTGPTVVIPLLRQIRPDGPVGTVAKWEGIAIDPIGASLATLVLEVILLLNDPSASAGSGSAALHVATGLGLTIGGSIVLGGGAAALLVAALNKRLIPDYLRNPVTLTLVVAAFAGAEAIQHEAGLLTTTLMGIFVANQSYVPVQRIVEFKEDLQVLLIGTLFVLLSARLELAAFESIGLRTLLLVAVLVVVVRPLAVVASSVGTDLSWKEWAFLGWLAPRGIVAAAVASLFALDVAPIFPETAPALVPVVFTVIVGTVAVYGLSAGWLASRLGLADPDPGGILFVGADEWVRDVASVLSELGITVRLVDSNPDHVRQAQQKGLAAQRGDVLSESILEELELGGIGRLLIAIPNDEVASLTALHFSEIFDSTDIFQLPARRRRSELETVFPRHLRGHLLFGEDASCRSIKERWRRGEKIVVLEIDDDASLEALRQRIAPSVLPLFIVRGDELVVFSEEGPEEPRPGDKILLLAPADLAHNLEEASLLSDPRT